MNGLARWLRPGPIVGIAVLASVPVRALIQRLADPDVWWHLRTGELIATTRSIPTRDIYSYTAAGEPWTVQEWGAELILHGLREAFGLWGILGYTAVVLLAIYLVVARILTRYVGTGMGAWVLIGVTIYAGATNWTERPNLLSYLLFAVTLDLIDRRDRRAILWFLPIAVLWANLHGMVLVGLGLVLVAAAAERLGVALGWEGADAAWARRLGLVFAAGTVLTLFNPNGVGLYTHAFGLLRTVRDVVTEWASPDFHEVGTVAFLGLLLLAILVLAVRPGKPPVFDVAAVLAFTYLALQARRNLAIASIVLGYAAARSVGPAARALYGERPAPAEAPASVPLGVTGLLVVLVGLGAVTVDGLPDSDDVHAITEEETFAIDAIDALPGPGVRVFAFDRWAPMVIDRAWPDAHVYFDTRSDVYGEELVDRYRATIAALPGWDENLDRDCTTHVLVTPTQPLNQVLELSEDWVIERSDDLSVTWVRARQAPGCAEVPIPRAA